MSNDPSITKRILDGASESVRRLNPGLFGSMAGLEAGQRKPLKRAALGRKKEGARPRPDSPVYCVAIIGCFRVVMDSDNFTGGCKGLRDAIADRLGVDDSDKWVRWEYSQVETKGAEGVIVKISKP